MIDARRSKQLTGHVEDSYSWNHQAWISGGMREVLSYPRLTLPEISHCWWVRDIVFEILEFGSKAVNSPTSDNHCKIVIGNLRKGKGPLQGLVSGKTYVVYEWIVHYAKDRPNKPWGKWRWIRGQRTAKEHKYFISICNRDQVAQYLRVVLDRMFIVSGRRT